MIIEPAPPKNLAEKIIFFTPIRNNMKRLYEHPYIHPHMVMSSRWTAANQISLWLVDLSVLQITGTSNGYKVESIENFNNEPLEA
jgi:hypothetical protein